MLSMYQALYQAFICTVWLNRPIHYTHVTDEETGSRSINNLPKFKKKELSDFHSPCFWPVCTSPSHKYLEAVKHSLFVWEVYLGWQTIQVYPEGFWNMGLFSAKTRKVPGKLRWVCQPIFVLNSVQDWPLRFLGLLRAHLVARILLSSIWGPASV